jgi:hypothetical protein
MIDLDPESESDHDCHRDRDTVTVTASHGGKPRCQCTDCGNAAAATHDRTGSDSESTKCADKQQCRGCCFLSTSRMFRTGTLPSCLLVSLGSEGSV